MLGRDRGQPAGLRLDGRDHLGVLVPDVDVDELAREVEEPPPVVVPDVRALAPRDYHRVERYLCGPGVEHVGTVEGMNLGTAGCIAGRLRHPPRVGEVAAPVSRAREPDRRPTSPGGPTALRELDVRRAPPSPRPCPGRKGRRSSRSPEDRAGRTGAPLLPAARRTAHTQPAWPAPPN